MNREENNSNLIQNESKGALKKKIEAKFNTGHWTEKEHSLFIEAILKKGNNWKYVQKFVATRSQSQSRSHAQKFFLKIHKNHIKKKKNNQNNNIILSMLATEIYNCSPLMLNERNIEKFFNLYQVFHPNSDLGTQSYNSSGSHFKILKEKVINSQRSITNVENEIKDKIYEKNILECINDFAILIPNFSKESSIKNSFGSIHAMNFFQFNLFIDKKKFDDFPKCDSNIVNIEISPKIENKKINVEIEKNDNFLKFILNLCQNKHSEGEKLINTKTQTKNESLHSNSCSNLSIEATKSFEIINKDQSKIREISEDCRNSLDFEEFFKGLHRFERDINFY